MDNLTSTLIGTVVGTLIAQVPTGIRYFLYFLRRRRAERERLKQLDLDKLLELQNSLNTLLEETGVTPTEFSESRVTACASCLRNATLRQHVFDWMDRYHREHRWYPDYTINDFSYGDTSLLMDTSLPMATRALQTEIVQEIRKTEK